MFMKDYVKASNINQQIKNYCIYSILGHTLNLIPPPSRTTLVIFVRISHWEVFSFTFFHGNIANSSKPDQNSYHFKLLRGSKYIRICLCIRINTVCCERSDSETGRKRKQTANQGFFRNFNSDFIGERHQECAPSDAVTVCAQEKQPVPYWPLNLPVPQLQLLVYHQPLKQSRVKNLIEKLCS